MTIRAMVSTSDEYGGSTETTSDVATVWAAVEPLEGSEAAQFMQTGMKVPHRFTITYRAGVTGATELLYGSRRFNVTSVGDPDERHRDLVILADEITA